jgi:TRAP-type C4-dicarboxylate transport system substrate-binding protein
MMRRIILSILAGLFVAPLFLASAQAADPIILTFGDTSSPGQVEYKGVYHFEGLLKKRSGGKIGQVQYFHSSQLGSDKKLTQAALAGSIDIAHSSAGNFGEVSNALLFCDLPGLFQDWKHVRRVWQSPVRYRVVDAIKKETGLTVIWFNIDGGWPREIGNSKKAVRVPSDMKGIKMRTTGSPIEVSLYKNWGAGAIPIAWSEIYTSVQQRVVDGYYNQPIFTVKAKLHEVSNYFTFIGQSYVTAIKMMGPSAEKKLGPDLTKLVIQAGWDTEIWTDKGLEADSDAAVEAMKAAGMELIRLTAEEQKLWDAASQMVWAEYVGPGKVIPQSLVDEINALRE